MSFLCQSYKDLRVIDLQNPRDTITDRDTCVKTKSAEKCINTDLNVMDFDKYSALLEQENLIKSKERELKSRENIIRKKETELNKVTLKLAHSRTYILKLEKRINELEKSKKKTTFVLI